MPVAETTDHFVPGARLALECTVERIRFESDDRCFQVLVVRDPQGVSRTVVARDAMLELEESARITGTVGRHRSGELQLEAELVERVLPSTREGLISYLSSAQINGIGPKLASDIVATFGERTLEVLDTAPERLREVPGIGDKRLAQIMETWSQTTAVRNILIFLQSHGVPPSFAMRIFRSYGARAVPVVKADPYRLAREVRGIGFVTADRIARRLGVAGDDPRRARAGLTYVLSQAMGDGHVFLPRTELIARASELLQIDVEALAVALQAAVDEQLLVVEPLEDQADLAVYRPDTFGDEETLARRIDDLVSARVRVPKPSSEQLEALERRLPFPLASGQRRALEVLLGGAVGVLTGGPGTGKTTIVRAVVDFVLQRGLRVELAAPTGRAAKRLSESTDLEARTLHRLLEFDPRTGAFGRDRFNPIDADLVIVDEASMLDLGLARALTEAIAPGCALLLVGDVEQLPPVGAGDVLRDLIASGTLPVARLERVFRQAENSQILDCAHAIRHGEVPQAASGAQGEFFFIRTSSPEAAVDTVERLVTARIPEAFGFDPMRQVQVLVPTHRGPVGTRALNERLQAALGIGGAAAVGRGSHRFHVGDKVMQTRNNYQLETFNGDVGVVAAADPAAGVLTVDFDGRPVRYEADTIEELDLAYAISVHKSQGSEFPAVVVLLMTHHYKLLSRNLIYTAATRAQQLLVLVGMPKALQMAVDNVSAVDRHTRLAWRLTRRLG